MPREYAARIMQVKRRAFTSSAPVHETVSYQVDDNEYRTFDLLVTPDLDEAGRPRGITCISVELTESVKRGASRRHRKRSRTPKPSGSASLGEVRVGDLTIDVDSNSLRGPAQTVRLTRTERRLLRRLLESPGRVVPREELLERIWGPAYTADTGLLHDAVSRLRHRFREAGLAQDLIQTVHGIGYVLRTT
jgi:hypothetical protein